VFGTQGPNTYDCSGFMSVIINVLLDEPESKRFRRRFGTGSMGSVLPKLGFKDGPGDANDFTVGFSTKKELSRPGHPAPAGHTAGSLGGLNVECRGGDGVVVGLGARGAAHKLFKHRMHLPILARAAEPPRPMPKSFPGVLKRGGRGDNVKLVQAALKIGGAPLEGTGTFGPMTEKHVKLFQVHRGLPANGEVDKATWERLMAFLKPPATALHRVGKVGQTLNLRDLAKRFAKEHWETENPDSVELMLRGIVDLNPSLKGKTSVPGGFALKVPTTRP